jgi:hypothetical protein
VGRFFDRNIWPDFRVFRIQRQPFLKPRLGVGLDRVELSVLSADRSGELIHGVGALPKSATPSMAAPAHVDLGHAIGIAGKPHFLARQFRRLCVPKTSSIRID